MLSYSRNATGSKKTTLAVSGPLRRCRNAGRASKQPLPCACRQAAGQVANQTLSRTQGLAGQILNQTKMKTTETVDASEMNQPAAEHALALAPQ